MVAWDASIAVYMMSNQPLGTLYIGVTSQFQSRIIQHREGLIPGFTRRYGLKRLVWYEPHELMTVAIQRVAEGMAASVEDQSDRAGQSNLG